MITVIIELVDKIYLVKKMITRKQMKILELKLAATAKSLQSCPTL